MLWFIRMVPTIAARGVISAAAPLTLIPAMSFRSAEPVVLTNDNTVPAGRLRGDTLHIRLAVQLAAWRPESDSGAVVIAPAFREEGEAPRVPAPLIRVKEGTVIAATVRNSLADSSITLFGLNSHPVRRDSVMLRPGESRELVFSAGAAGTYLYRARIGTPTNAENDQVAGGFIVDPPGGSPPDRVFVINIWGRPIDSTKYSNALTINGRSWPWTERVDVVVGDTLRWRVINASGREHPMHLHGAYFRVDSKGNMFADTTYAADQRRLAVTEDMRPRTTMTFAWSALSPGRWLFHCHLMFHVTPTDARVNPAPGGGHDAHSVNPTEHMAGLVIGINARLAPGAIQQGRPDARRLNLYVQEGPRRGRALQSMSFVLQRGASAPRADSVELPGSTLLLTRGQPTDITVHNRMSHATSVHWHGLELESFSDGVAGWGGTAAMPTPAVEPGGKFTARLSMPRAGTFIYHTHLRDAEQLSSGLYGALIVSEPGRPLDPRTDHVHVLGWDWDGRTEPQQLVNGDSTRSTPIEMRRGETHRFRFINIGAAALGSFAIRRDTTLAEWRAVAKDGAEHPAAQRVLKKAIVSVDVGETYDFEFTATEAGEYVLSTPTIGKGRRWERTIIVR